MQVNGSGVLTGDLTVDTNTLYVNSTSNKVGIGTSTPDQFDALTVYGGLGATINSGSTYIAVNTNDATADARFQSTVGGVGTWYWGIDGSEGNKFRISDTFNFSNPQLTVSGNNTGIGTTSPISKLSVQGSSGLSALNVASSTGSPIIYADRTAKVGIATNSPQTTLDIDGSARAGVQVVSDTSGTATIDWSLGNTFDVTLTSTGRTIAFTNVKQGQTIKLALRQDNAGSKTVTTWPTGIKWPNGTVATLTTTANKVDNFVVWTSASTTEYFISYQNNF